MSCTKFLTDGIQVADPESDYTWKKKTDLAFRLDLDQCGKLIGLQLT
jgi:hypothetical protein